MLSSKTLSSKINTFIESKKIYNILKVVFLLILLLMIYMYFTNNLTYNNFRNVSEGFVSSQDYIFYGNVITLKNPLNKPAYSGNQCIFDLGELYRIDTLQFNFNYNSNNNSSNIIKYEPDQTIYIQYMDGDGNMRYIKSGNRSDSPPSIHSATRPTLFGSGIINDEYYLLIKNITDEQNLPVYTSKLIILIGSSSVNNDNPLNEYTDARGYISSFGIYGGQRTLLSMKAYDDIKKKLIKSISNDGVQNDVPERSITTFTFKNINVITNGDMKVYSIMLTINQTPEPTIAKPAPKCFEISIQYNNTIYLTNNFTINNNYKVRNDIYRLVPGSSGNYPPPASVFIFLDEPIIANRLIFSINLIEGFTLSITSLTVNGLLPTTDDITDFKRNVNNMNNDTNADNSDVCPNINDLLEKQSKTQAICDNLEFQDKVKSEKLRLERNKQYLLKLKDQQEKIDDLNNIIQELENKRSARSDTTEHAKLLQYQNQKGSVSTIRDLANQRLESQDKNSLYMDLNLNYT